MLLGLKLRKGVVGVFTNPAGEVLVGERANDLGAWQFPQGGIDDGEDFDQALRREMFEELGTDAFEILRSNTSLTTYTFPATLQSRIVKEYDGQSHKWYLLRFVADAQPVLAKCDGEFCSFKWVPPKDALQLVVDWKRDAYRQGLLLLNVAID